MENLPGLCYKLSTPVPPGSASSGQSHLSDLQPSHNGNKQPMFCMVAFHLRRTLHTPPVPLLFVLAKAPPHRCSWAGEEHSTSCMPLSDIPLCDTQCEGQTNTRCGEFVELLEESQYPTLARVRKMSQHWIHPAQPEQGCLAR